MVSVVKTIFMKKLNFSTTGATEGFTNNQLERFYALSHIYGEDAARLVPMLKARGENSYAKVYDKAVSVNRARGVDADYYSSLSGQFEDYLHLTIELIVSIVSEVRAEHDLPPYVTKIKTKSLNDYFKLFVFEEIFEETEDGIRGTLIGYRPLFRLKSN